MRGELLDPRQLALSAACDVGAEADTGPQGPQGHAGLGEQVTGRERVLWFVPVWVSVREGRVCLLCAFLPSVPGSRPFLTSPQVTCSTSLGSQNPTGTESNRASTPSAGRHGGGSSEVRAWQSRAFHGERPPPPPTVPQVGPQVDWRAWRGLGTQKVCILGHWGCGSDPVGAVWDAGCAARVCRQP